MTTAAFTFALRLQQLPYLANVALHRRVAESTGAEDRWAVGVVISWREAGCNASRRRRRMVRRRRHAALVARKHRRRLRDCARAGSTLPWMAPTGRRRWRRRLAAMVTVVMTRCVGRWPWPWPWGRRPCWVFVEKLGHAQYTRHAVNGDLHSKQELHTFWVCMDSPLHYKR